MSLIKIEFEFGKSKFDKELIKFLQFLCCAYRIALENWKKEGRKKKPKILETNFVKVTTIISFFLIFLIPLSVYLVETGSFKIVGLLILIPIVIFIVFAFIFTFILLFIYILYLSLRLIRSFSKTFKYITKK